MTGATPRVTPCATCPYRRNVPAGIWHPEEYAKLPRYDADLWQQPPNVFMCHQADGCVCSGWLGHVEHPGDLLAVRLGLIDGRLDGDCADYLTDVDLFWSGAEAAAHGMSGVAHPDGRAAVAIDKLLRQRGRSTDG